MYTHAHASQPCFYKAQAYSARSQDSLLTPAAAWQPALTLEPLQKYNTSKVIKLKQYSDWKITGKFIFLLM